MKRPSTSSKEAALARKRALIRALIEQAALADGTPVPSNPAPVAGEPPSNIIQFPRPAR